MTERKPSAKPEAETGGANAVDRTEETLPDAAPADPQARTAALEVEVGQLRDKLLRTLAESENVRRRVQREKEDAHKYAVSAFAREMLTVADNLHRALASVEAGKQQDEGFKALVEGVEMTARAMQAAFERAGIRRIEAVGRRFDHNLHEALMELEDAAQPAGTAVQEFETGYVLNDRLLRPAKVAVSRGGPPPVAEGGGPDDGAGAKDGVRAKVCDKPAGPGSHRVDENL